MPEHAKPAGAPGQSAMHVLLGIWTSIFITQGLCLELQEELACDNEEFQLECDGDSFLAIHEARFTTNASEGVVDCVVDYDSNDNTFIPATNSSCTEDIRMPLNYRCSGNQSCTFSLVKHYPTRLCQDPGTVIVLYDCVSDSRVHKNCNRPVLGNEGYVKSPGYPNFYPGPLKCNWPLKAREGQRMLVSILDLSVAESLSDGDNCRDRFRLVDGQARLLDTCGEKRNTLRQFESEGSDVTAQFYTHAIGAKRGVLLWYKTFGCPTLPAPEHGYLVYRNSSFAQYLCCKDHYFEDTIERTRYLFCLEGSYWNTRLAACLDKKTLRELKNISSFIPDDFDNFQTVQQERLSDTDVIFDIVVPSAIMGILVLGNAIIVAVLLKLRKSVKDEADMESTFNSPTHQTDIQHEIPPDKPPVRPPVKPQVNPPVNQSVNPVNSHIHMKPSTSTEQMRPKQKLVTQV